MWTLSLVSAIVHLLFVRDIWHYVSVFSSIDWVIENVSVFVNDWTGDFASDQ